LFVIFAQSWVDNMQVAHLWMEEHSDWKFDALHISVRSLCEDFILSGLHVVDNGLFYERDFEVEALPVDLWWEWAREFVELDGVMTDIDCIMNVLP